MKILILALFSALGFQLYSQGNLQFNQVLTQTGSISIVGQGWVGSNVFTVPSGKVWKIENVMGSTSGSIIRFGLSVNGTLGVIESGLTNGNAGYKSSAPTWLKAGDQLQFAYYGSSAATTNSGTFIISIIEFNIIP
jgi:hypothetical protein